MYVHSAIRHTSANQLFKELEEYINEFVSKWPTDEILIIGYFNAPFANWKPQKDAANPHEPYFDSMSEDALAFLSLMAEIGLPQINYIVNSKEEPWI